MMIHNCEYFDGLPTEDKSKYSHVIFESNRIGSGWNGFENNRSWCKKVAVGLQRNYGIGRDEMIICHHGDQAAGIRGTETAYQKLNQQGYFDREQKPF